MSSAISRLAPNRTPRATASELRAGFHLDQTAELLDWVNSAFKSSVDPCSPVIETMAFTSIFLDSSETPHSYLSIDNLEFQHSPPASVDRAGVGWVLQSKSHEIRRSIGADYSDNSVNKIIFINRTGVSAIHQGPHFGLFLLDYSKRNHRNTSDHVPIRRSLPSWVTDFYDRPQGKAARSDLKSMFSNLGDLLEKKDLSTIDYILEEVDWSRLPSELVMGLPRASVVVRAHLRAWREATSRAASELRKRNLPAERIMIGLLEKTPNSADTRT